MAELLIAIAVGVTLVALGSQLLSVSLNSSKNTKERDEAMGLAQEGMEAARAIIRGNDGVSQGWNRIYLPPDGTGHASSAKGVSNFFHPEIISDQWQLVSGSEEISLAGETYTRKIIIENVSRDASKEVEAVYNSANDDPTTQKVTVIVSKTGAPDAIITTYFSRFINESGPQTSWAGATDSNGPFPATSSPAGVGSGTETGNVDRSNANCSPAGTCLRLQPQ